MASWWFHQNSFGCKWQKPNSNTNQGNLSIHLAEISGEVLFQILKKKKVLKHCHQKCLSLLLCFAFLYINFILKQTFSWSSQWLRGSSHELGLHHYYPRTYIIAPEVPMGLCYNGTFSFLFCPALPSLPAYRQCSWDHAPEYFPHLRAGLPMPFTWDNSQHL